MIHDQIKTDLKTAMKEKDATRLSVIRGILSALTNEAVAKGKKPDEILTDDEALAVIKRQAKQRKDSIEQFEAGGRPELAESEKQELIIIEGYLPEPMSRDEIEKIAEAKKAELGITDPGKSGILVGAIMKETGGNADGQVVKEIVENLLK